jgi:hypothetical protein
MCKEIDQRVKAVLDLPIGGSWLCPSMAPPM